VVTLETETSEWHYNCTVNMILYDNVKKTDRQQQSTVSSWNRKPKQESNDKRT